MNCTTDHIPATTSATINLTSSADSRGKALANPASPTEAAPAPRRPIPYPDWPEVFESLLDAFARLDAARRPAQGVSAQIVPADGPPPATAPPANRVTFLLCAAGGERPGVVHVDQIFDDLLEVVMAQHLRVLLQHNRQERLGGLTQSSEGGQAV